MAHKGVSMEFGGPYDEMVFENFRELEKTVHEIQKYADARKMLTQSEHEALKKLKAKVHLHTDEPRPSRERLENQIDALLKKYYTYYNG